jgi:hypothetical protein
MWPGRVRAAHRRRSPCGSARHPAERPGKEAGVKRPFALRAQLRPLADSVVTPDLRDHLLEPEALRRHLLSGLRWLPWLSGGVSGVGGYGA